MHTEQDPHNFPSCPYCESSDNNCDHVFAAYERTFFYLQHGCYLKGKTSHTEKKLLKFFNDFSEKYGYDNIVFKSGNLHLDQMWRRFVKIQTDKDLAEWYVSEYFIFKYIPWEGLLIKLSGLQPANGCYELRSIKRYDVTEVYFSENPAKTWAKTKKTLGGLLKKTTQYAEKKHTNNKSKYIEQTATWDQIETITESKKWFVAQKSLPKPGKNQKSLKHGSSGAISLDLKDFADNSDKFVVVDDYLMYRHTRAYIDRLHGDACKR